MSVAQWNKIVTTVKLRKQREQARRMIQRHKEQVSYTDHGTKAEHCSICTHFIGPATCEVVLGRVSPQGWCNQFRKSGSPKQAKAA